MNNMGQKRDEYMPLAHLSVRFDALISVKDSKRKVKELRKDKKCFQPAINHQQTY
jgi:hypothetical protein